MKAWAIKKWNDVFETASSRKLARLDYLATPVGRESARYDRLMETMPGVAAFGHFRALVAYAATLPCRGLLVRSGQPLTIDKIAQKIGTPGALLRRSWAILISPEIGWVSEVEVDLQNMPSLRHWDPERMPTTARQPATVPPTSRQEPPDNIPLNTHPPTHPRDTYTHPPTHQENAHTPPNPQSRQRSALELTPVFAAYPQHRQVGKAKALRAIREALDAIEARGEPDAQAWLVGRVEAFAKSPAGNAGQFTPKPENWFADGRYDDGPGTWETDNGQEARGSKRKNQASAGAPSAKERFDADQQDRAARQYPASTTPLPR